MEELNPQLAPLSKQWAVLLTTYKRDGTPVGTAVNIAVDGGRAYVRSAGNTGKIKRVRNNPEVEVAPCKPSGQPTGPAIHAHARVLNEDDEAETKRASDLINHKHPIVQRAAVQLGHKLMRYKTMYIELTPVT
jgi:PPOX class probable F420-dependent enzyme